MAMLRKRGVKFTENIDDKYILSQDEQYRTPAEEAVRLLKDIGKLYVDDAIDRMIDTVYDPEFRKKVIDKGAEIFINFIMKRIQNSSEKSGDTDSH
jgi:hypothetical protein